MSWIEQIGEEQAEGSLARAFAAARKRAGHVYNILRVQSQNGTVLSQSMSFYATIMLGESPLSRAQREMIAVVVSKTNGCHY